MPIIKNSEELQRLQDIIRFLDRSDLTEERRVELETEKARLEKILEEKQKQLLNKEAIRMEEVNQQVAEQAPPKKEKKKLIKELVAEVEEQAYNSLKEFAKGDKKVLVSLTQKLLGRFRDEKKQTGEVEQNE